MEATSSPQPTNLSEVRLKRFKLSDKLNNTEAFKTQEKSQMLEPESQFDWQFYVAYYEDLTSLSSYDEALKHWLKFGKHEQRYGSEADLYERLKLEHPDLPEDFNYQDYLKLNPDVEKICGNSQCKAIHHFLHNGLLEGREYNVNSPFAHYKLGRILTTMGRLDEAICAYRQVLTLHPKFSDSTSDYLSVVIEIIQLGCSWLWNGLGTFVQERLFNEIEISPPRLCDFNKSFLFPPELILIETLASLEKEIPSEEQILKLDTYYRRSSQSQCQRQLYVHTLQPMIAWAYNQIFCHYIDSRYLGEFEQTNLQKLIIVLSRIVADQYEDFHIALNLTNVGLNLSENLPLLHIAVRMNAKLGRHYEVISIAQKCFQRAPLSDANLYMLAAASYIEVADKSLPSLLNSIEQILVWAANAFKLNPSSSRPRQLIDTVLARFANQVNSKTYELGIANNLSKALSIRHTALRQLDQLVNLRCQLLSSTLNFPYKEAIGRPRFNRCLLVGTDHLPQCYYYRIQQKLSHLKMCGLKANFMSASDLSGLQWQQQLMEIDLIILCRVPANFEVLRLLHYARNLEIPVLYDIDDLIFDEAHFPASLESYAGMIDRQLHVHLALDNPSFQVVISACSGVITSTKSLAEQARHFASDDSPIWIYPNLIGDELAVSSHVFSKTRFDKNSVKDSKKNERIQLFYGSGTKAHKQLFYELLAPVLTQILKKYEQVNISLIGYFELPESLKPFEDRISIEAFIDDYSSYLYQLCGADINLAILEEGTATDCKSEIKWLEAAAFKVPSVVSPTKTYCYLLRHGEEVLFAKTHDEWVSALSSLIEDLELRQRIGQTAYLRGQADYTAEAGQRYMMQILNYHLPVVPQIKRKRLLVVNVFFAPQSIGGATLVAEAQVRYLLEHCQDDYEVYVLCAEHDFSIRSPYEVEQYRFGNALVTKLYVPRQDWKEYQDPQVLSFCYDFYCKYDFDLIHFHCVQVLTASAVDAAREAQIPYVVTVHDAWWLSQHQFLVDGQGRMIDPNSSESELVGVVQSWETEQGWKNCAVQCKEILDRRSHLLSHLRAAQGVLAVSEPFADIYRSAGLDNVIVNENGIEIFEVLPKVDSVSGRVRVAHIGGISCHKGFHLFREALESERFQNLEALVIDHSLAPGEVFNEVWGSTNVTLRAKVRRSEINELYSQIDVLVAPSIWPESYGLVAREALHAGVWVIASDRGAIGADVLKGINGDVISVDDKTQLLEALEKVNDNYHNFLKSRHSEDFKCRKVAEQMEELIDFYGQL